jgi:ATP/maltotriose-dependent transcriptional regulator MalT
VATTDPAARRPAREHDLFVGRADELATLERAFDRVESGRPLAIELAGVAGIGKTRLLREVTRRAETRGQLVLSGSASELERDLPFSVFVDALDEYLGGLDRRSLAGLDESVQGELAHVFPSMSYLATQTELTLQHERYRSHRAVRGLLEQLAEATPLVLVLDDFHWADSASLELLGALLRRPPAARVLTVLALRPRQMPDRFAGALERACRAAALIRMDLGALTPDEARELLGEAVDDEQATVLYDECGGNPFYLEQVGRSLERTGRATSEPGFSMSGITVPPAVAASLSDELAFLSDDARRVLEGASVAGDPFEPELAAAAASVPESSAIEAVDELLRLDLVRPTDMPRRFRFRHPLVRRAVYEAAAAGWRLGAHERCAEALEARGATPAGRAHHVERSAREGDVAAVALLREAGESAARLAPASAAHWFAAAVRLLPETTTADERVELLLARAGALTATGRFADSHETLLQAIAIVPDDSMALRAKLTRACAAVEQLLGRHEQAHERLVRMLEATPTPASPESIALLIELAWNDFYRSKYDAMQVWSARAADAAQELGNAPVKAAALSMLAMADAMAGAGDVARVHRNEAAAVVDRLSDEQLSLHVDAAAWLSGAELYLDLFADADVHAARALTLARANGQGELFLVLYQILGRAWYVRGKLAEATELLDGAIEAARLLDNKHALAWNLFNRSVVAVAVGDMDIAMTTAQESVELARRMDEGFVLAWAAVRLASVLLESGHAEQAVELMVSSAGGDELTLIPGGWRTYCLELLTRSLLALGRRDEAKRTADYAEARAAAVRLPLAAAWARRATAAVALYDGDAARSASLALESAAAADEGQAPIEAALSRTLAGRALAEAGRHDRAVAELGRAAAELDRCGAFRYRDAAERELGKLGHRTHRRTTPGRANGAGVETLTARELQVARLVVDRRTNPEIAAELFLSNKTVESHLRNIFRKLNVASRVELARAVERALRTRNAQET